MSSPDLRLTLPEQFVLLLHKPDGSRFDTIHATVETAGAELGELVLRHRVAFEDAKLRVLGTGPIGEPRLDAMLEEMTERAGAKDKPVDPTALLDSRAAAGAGALNAYRASLADRGLLARRPRKILGLFRADRFIPRALVRDALLGEVGQVVRVERPIDSRLAMLCALVHVSGLAESSGFGRREREMLASISKQEKLGQTVETAIQVAVVIA